MSRAASRVMKLFMLTLLGPTLATAASPKAADDAAQQAVKRVPTSISGTYEGGELVEMQVRDRMAYLVKPKGEVDSERRWVWICPFWLGINNGFGNVEHRFYVEQMLAKGFHVAGIHVGTSCGSPGAAAVCHEFYERLVEEHRLNPRCRIVGQSNGGLIAYAWAFRHPDCVERIGGICPATDFRSWPGLYNTVNFPLKGLDFGVTYAEIQERASEFNPIDNLAPLAEKKVKILHIHGDKDELVPMQENSTELAERYRKLGGEARIVVLEGLGHGGRELYDSQPLIEFLTEK